jgi:RNA polymerase sigma factor (sigma-70 family)
MAMLPVQAPVEQGSVHEIRPRLAGSSFRGLAGRSDERLVSIAKEGDERAFETLYERHSPAIHRYCRSLLRSTQEAEDVKQEVFVLAISALRRGAEPNAFRPWLYRVAHNACMSHLRMRRPVLVADNGVLVGPAAAAEPVQHHREELRQLLDDIGKLPDVQRGALLLREMDGFSYEQVGEVLGLSLSTVRASIFRARRTLQGLAEARDADCEVIQSELCELVDRRGRRSRHITSHLTVCSHCRDFRDGLRRRPAVLGAVSPVSPLGAGGLLLVLKGKLLGGAAASGSAGSAVATATGGGAGVAKIAAVAVSSIALLAGAGVEADRVIEHGRRDAAVTPHRSTAARAARAVPTFPARATVRQAAGGVTVSAPDTIREGGPVAALTGRAAPSDARARAHARVKGAPAKGRTAAPGTPRATVPATAGTAPAGGSTTTTAGGREHEGGETTSTASRRHDGRHGSGRGDDSYESKSEGGSNGSGSDRAEEPAEHPSAGSNPNGDSASSRPGTPGGGDSPDTPSPSHSENSGTPVPSGPPADEAGTPATPGSPGTAPNPTPTPDPPADPAPDPASTADQTADQQVGDAGTTASAMPADPAAVTILPQP